MNKKNFSKSNQNASIKYHEPSNSKVFFNQSPVNNKEIFKAILRIGRIVYINLHEDIINYRENKGKKLKPTRDLDSAPIFVTPQNNSIDNKPALNEIQLILPKIVFLLSKNQDLITKSCNEFQSKYGFPYLPDDDYFEVSDNKPILCKYVNFYPFIAISFIIYVMSEIDNNIKEIEYYMASTGKEQIDTKNNILEKNYTLLNQYIQILNLNDLLPAPFNKNDLLPTQFNKDDLNVFCNLFCNKINDIERNTPYLFYTYNIAYDCTAKYKFQIRQEHNSLLSIAWDVLKKNLCSNSYVQNYKTTYKICEFCHKSFEANRSDILTCGSSICEQKYNNQKSRKSYENIKLLKNALITFYNNLNTQQLNKLPQETTKMINKYISMSESEIKNSRKPITTLNNLISKVKSIK